MRKVNDPMTAIEPERYELSPQAPAAGPLGRREWIQYTTAGLFISVFAPSSIAQMQGSPASLEARIAIAADGRVTIFNGKVEEGQGARTELQMAAAEELRLPLDKVEVVMADTSKTPSDGITAGSRTTPSTVPAVRQACATARRLLTTAAASALGVAESQLRIEKGIASAQGVDKRFGYSDLARLDSFAAARKAVPAGAPLTPQQEWKTLGRPHGRVDGVNFVTGAHKFPSDLSRPGMLYGAVLRPSSFGAELESLDTAAASSIAGASGIRDGDFAGCVASSSYAARQGVAAMAATAKWRTKPQPSSAELFDHLKRTARGNGRVQSTGDAQTTLAAAAVKLSATYRVAYVQHAPMEPRAALAEWNAGELTVWTGTSNPFSVRDALAKTFSLDPGKVRVIVPDFGGGFGGKHTGEAAIEAARLARHSGKPVSVRWTRAEEFTWAYSRPAALIETAAALEGGRISAWDLANYNSGTAAIETPYAIANRRSRFIECDSPLRQGSYRCLAAAANNFARESFMDELAERAGEDPLEFRLAHLENARPRAVLIEAAKRFGWEKRYRSKTPGRGVGLACGTEKNSVVAACVEIEMGAAGQPPRLVEICQAFECGPILNPLNLRQQVEGCIIMGLGAALREQMVFEQGRVVSSAFSRYRVPRFADLPKMEIVLVENKDIEPAGSGETPIIAVAPAMANAVFHASEKRVRQMPIIPG